MVQAEQKPNERAPVMGDEVHPIDLEHVEEGSEIGRKLLLLVASRRRL
jgi:hypothetical protein